MLDSVPYADIATAFFHIGVLVALLAISQAVRVVALELSRLRQGDDSASAATQRRSTLRRGK